jgi:isopenicillin-N epimerase
MTNHTEIKSQFLLNKNIIFLNHGSFGATPKPVFEAYQSWQRRLEDQPVKMLGREAHELLQKARIDLSHFLHTHHDNLAFIPNATTAINIIAHSLDLGPGDEVLTSDQEYGAMDRVWKFLSQKKGFNYRQVPTILPMRDPDEFVENFWKSVSDKTKVIYLSHITSPTAAILPIEKIINRANEKNIISIIDGAHAPGQIDLDLNHLGACFYTGNLHKWLCAPKGSAFLFARPDCQQRLEPLIVSWGWQPEQPGVSPFVDFFDWTGTTDISAYLSVSDAIQFFHQYNHPQLRQHQHNLLEAALSQISQLTKIAPIYPRQSDWYYQMASSPLPDEVNIDQLKSQLYDNFNIEVPVIKWNQKNLIRISMGLYNSENDLHALINALCRLLH